MDKVAILPPDRLLERIGQPVNPYLCVLIEQQDADPLAIRCIVSEWRETPAPRSLETTDYIFDLARRYAAEAPIVAPFVLPRDILFQAEDNPADAPGVSWQSRAHWSFTRLVPDLYYHQRRGYHDYRPTVPHWRDRRPRMIWRGSSTGIVQLTESALGNLARYRLCVAARDLGDLADVKMIGVVQAATEAEHGQITERLAAERLLADFLPMETMADDRYIVDIDGNASAWNLMAKLRLGSCLLRVESEWYQWFSNTFRPWEHYVPVSADLSDLADRFAWCLKNDDEAERIAMRGRQFALDMNYDDEMDSAARTLFAA